LPGTASHASTLTVRSRSRQTASAQTALALLKQDHKVVSKLAERFEKRGIPEEADRDGHLRALTIHATIEEAIFYPAVRAGRRPGVPRQ
jgi:hypothetical protein